jgi:hypothetical protein
MPVIKLIELIEKPADLDKRLISMKFKVAENGYKWDNGRLTVREHTIQRAEEAYYLLVLLTEDQDSLRQELNQFEEMLKKEYSALLRTR